MATPVERTILFEDRIPRFQEKYEILTATELSSRPERTRISYCAKLATYTYAPFCRERRMRIASANKLDRKSGGA
jgi:hypothetical protein